MSIYPPKKKLITLQREISLSLWVKLISHILSFYLETESINQEYFVVSISEVTTLVWTVTWPFCRPRPRLSCLVSTAHLRPASPLVVKTPKSAQAQWMLSGKWTINNRDGNPKRDVTLKSEFVFLLREYSISFSLCIAGDLPRNWVCRNDLQGSFWEGTSEGPIKLSRPLSEILEGLLLSRNGS